MPKSVAPLMNTQLLAAKPKPARYRLHDGRGLLLEVAPTGAKRWVLRYQFGGKPTMAALVNEAGQNDYPTVSLAEARKLAERARELLVVGIDPAPSKVAVAEAAALVEAKRVDEDAAKNTFKAVADSWYETRTQTWPSIPRGKPGWCWMSTCTPPSPKYRLLS